MNYVMQSDTVRLGYSVAEAAKAIGVSRATLYRAIARGDLPAWRLGRRLVVPRAALERQATSEPRRMDSPQRAGSEGARRAESGGSRPAPLLAVVPTTA